MLIALMLHAAAPGQSPVMPNGMPDASAFDRSAWGRFSRAPALRRSLEEVTIASDPDRGFRLRLVSAEPDGTVQPRWTDARTCPAVRDVVARFATLPVPRPQPPHPVRPDDIVVIADGVGYAVTLPVGYGRGSMNDRATFTSNAGSPLATWIDASLALARSCWPETPRL